FNNSTIPHCTQLTMKIFEQYQKDHYAMMEKSKHSPGRHCYTFDLWTNCNLDAFGGATHHF
ncbi:hypothetical protein JAAARDRAFT_102108, partial [Jaapia argillacea MUCL 33604]